MPETPARIRDAIWRPYLHLLLRGDEGGPAYAARIRRVSLRGLPEPVRQAVQALVGLVSADVLAKLTGIDFEQFVGPVERN
jgi:hypothetical protein